MARITRGYVPHRQMCPFMPTTISASLGFGLRANSDTAPRIIPGTQ
jgi:hypothetical protein